MSRKVYRIDMCNGPILSGIIAFSLPLMLSGCLQLLFNAADVIVVGRFAGNESLAAVGSTSSLTNLLVNLFIGLSIGTNVTVGHTLGSGDEQGTCDNVHTAVTVSLISGVVLIGIGVLFTRPLLIWMGAPSDVLDKAALYLKIIFIGMPATMAYNFGSAILRATGDTKRPLYFLSAAGMINVILNLFFVIVLHMDVAGVALATIISQCISAVLILLCLCRMEGPCRLNIRKLYIQPGRLRRMMQIGLPAGIQSSLFSFSNVLIQSSINSFGSVVVAGNSAGANIEQFVYISMNAVHQATVSFTSQNTGAGKPERINRTDHGHRRQSPGNTASVHLFSGFCRHRGRKDTASVDLGALFSVRDHGGSHGDHARTGLCHYPHDCGPVRRMSVPNRLACHRICMVSCTERPVSVLSGILDPDRCHPCIDLSVCPQASRTF